MDRQARAFDILSRRDDAMPRSSMRSSLPSVAGSTAATANSSAPPGTASRSRDGTRTAASTRPTRCAARDEGPPGHGAQASWRAISKAARRPRGDRRGAVAGEFSAERCARRSRPRAGAPRRYRRRPARRRAWTRAGRQRLRRRDRRRWRSSSETPCSKAPYPSASPLPSCAGRLKPGLRQSSAPETPAAKPAAPRALRQLSRLCA